MSELTVNGLPPRESDALKLIAEGLTAKEAARVMRCSPRNVEALIAICMQRLAARNRVNLITTAFQRGILRMMCLTLLVGACTTVLPVPAEAGEREEPIMRRLRSQRTGRGIRRIRRLRDDLSTINPSDKAVIDHYGLQPELLWDGELYLVYR